MIDHGFGVMLTPLSEVSSMAMLEWRNEPSVYKWCRQYEPLESWAHQKWLESLETRSDVKMYGIAIPSDQGKDLSVGVCGLTSIDLINRHAEFSLYVGPEYQGRGFGQKALKTLCAHGFLTLGLNHIFGETFDGNPAAHIFEQVGFVKEGSRRSYYYRDGRFIDAHLYSILNTEFRARWTP